MMTTIQFRDWELIVDKENTQMIYDKIQVDKGASCACKECQYFLLNREQIYPFEIKVLLTNLGINYYKECEVLHYLKDASGMNYYSGWFHFKGRFKQKSLSASKDGHILKNGLTSITDSFRIGFLYDDYLTLFDDKDDLVKVEFDTKTLVTYL